MNLDATIEIFANSDECRLYPPADDIQAQRIEQITPPLPELHRQFLKRVNGLSVHNGGIQLFGLGFDDRTDLVEFNRPDCWKFAWRYKELEEFFFIAQSAMGNLFAYDLGELRRNENPKIVDIGPDVMDVGEWEEDFSKFLSSSLVNMVGKSWDPDLVDLSRRMGPIPWGQRLTHSPSPLLTGRDPTWEEAMLMPIVQSLIIEGDIHTQYREKPSRSSKAQQVVPYTDAKGRGRIRIEWTD